MSCPYIVGDTTKHCRLAETRVRELESVLRVLAVDDTGGWCATRLSVDDSCGSCVPCRKRTAVAAALALLGVNE